MTFDVDVHFTDRTRLADGTYRMFRARVTVDATNDTDATMVATQLAMAVRADLNPMALGANVVL